MEPRGVSGTWEPVGSPQEWGWGRPTSPQPVAVSRLARPEQAGSLGPCCRAGCPGEAPRSAWLRGQPALLRFTAQHLAIYSSAESLVRQQISESCGSFLQASQTGRRRASALPLPGQNGATACTAAPSPANEGASLVGRHLSCCNSDLCSCCCELLLNSRVP